MDNLVRISASVASHVGLIKDVNENNFYLNGRSMYEYEVGSVQVSIEDSGQQYIFAVSDGMDRELPDKSSSVSVTKEIKRFHDKIKSSSKGIEMKLEQLCECVEETNNLFHSILLGNGDVSLKKPAFAGLLVSESKVAAVNLGNSRVYLLRDGVMKQLTADYEKTERLLKLGIITDEQAQMLSNRYGMPNEPSRSDLKRSDIIAVHEGDIFLLCSGGLPDMVDDDRIYEILTENETEDSGYISHLLLKEALRNGGEDNVTVLVAKVEKAGRKDEAADIAKPFPVRTRESSQVRQPTRHTKSSRRRSLMIRRAAAIVIAFVLIAGAFYGLYKLWASIANKDQPEKERTVASDQEPEQPNEQEEDFPEEIFEPEDGEDETTEPVEEDTGIGRDSAGNTTYRVKAGDSLYKISKMFYGDPEKYRLIMQANNIENPNLIQVGQVLVIPDPNQSVP